MTNPSAAPDAAPPLEAAAPPPQARDRNIALVCSVLLLIGMPIAYLPGSTGDVVALIAMLAVSFALMAANILWLVPRERLVGGYRASRTSLILGVVSILVGLVFWTGLPFAVGAGAIALGLSQRESAGAEGGRNLATLGAVLGTIAVVASFVVLLIG
jgi:hypothetical protein